MEAGSCRGRGGVGVVAHAHGGGVAEHLVARLDEDLMHADVRRSRQGVKHSARHVLAAGGEKRQHTLAPHHHRQTARGGRSV